MTAFDNTLLGELFKAATGGCGRHSGTLGKVSNWLIGVGAYSGYHFCYFEAMRHAPAAEVSMLAYLWPLLIVLLATLRPGEKLTAQMLTGALIALDKKACA